MRHAVLLAFTAALAGCASVVSNDGNIVVIAWDPGVQRKEDALDLAWKSCQEIGKKEIPKEIANVSVDPNMPSFMMKRRLSFRCG